MFLHTWSTVPVDVAVESVELHLNNVVHHMPVKDVSYVRLCNDREGRKNNSRIYAKQYQF